MPVPVRRPPIVATIDDAAITPADIEAWARVERALAGKRQACRRLRIGHAAAR
ncbi:hypothetical protein Q4610_03230 [Sphingobium sp. HBC34]|uniref:Transposase n=1 Tax=Sphingobium cyanobacteriorum TaxID=3063954 RepID=A0ABT8ZI82_9SPHN|nr:hypothetical protein [Sphingobium sp. HBC34]MDO7834048.1 hypothetical protein [Sphingobium sp. HBC34]